MKKMILLLVLAAITACAQKEYGTDAPTTYTMTVWATLPDDTPTRALTESTNPQTGKLRLNATWEDTDRVRVYNKTQGCMLTGTLSPSTPGSSSATLSGSISGTVNPGDELFLALHATNSFIFPYDGQKGFLDHLQRYDFCSATVTAASVSGGEITTSPAIFVNPQAIVRFNLYDENGQPIVPNSLEITSDKPFTLKHDLKTGVDTEQTRALTIEQKNDWGVELTNTYYVALHGISDSHITLIAHGDQTSYIYTRENVTFEEGKYYVVNVRMKVLTKMPGYINLSPDYRDYPYSDADTHVERTGEVFLTHHGGNVTYTVSFPDAVIVDYFDQGWMKYHTYYDGYRVQGRTVYITFTCAETGDYTAATATHTITFTNYSFNIPAYPNR